MRYEVGDRVKIKSLDWYNEHKNETDDIECSNNIWFYREMSKFCGKVMTISHVRADHYTMVEDLVGYWSDEMIECKIEEETKPEPKFKVGDILFYRGETCGYLKVEEIREENGEIRYYETSRNLYLIENDPNVFADKVCSVETEETKNNNNMEEKETLLGWIKESDNLRLVPHKDYEIKHDGDNFYLVKKKKEYPKTFLECCDVLNIGNLIERGVKGYKAELFDTLQKLYICREAYWKIAGEEMGLNRPWEPDSDTEVYNIYRFRDKIDISCSYCVGNCNILEFPTAEMRDAFYDNFKEKIEQCKKLL